LIDLEFVDDALFERDHVAAPAGGDVGAPVWAGGASCCVFRLDLDSGLRSSSWRAPRQPNWPNVSTINLRPPGHQVVPHATAAPSVTVAASDAAPASGQCFVTLVGPSQVVMLCER
jgi:hypothetical protein